MARVNRRMQHITGLTVKTAELLQVGWSLWPEDLGGVLLGEVFSQGAQAVREGSPSPLVLFLIKGPDRSQLMEGRSASAHSFSPPWGGLAAGACNIACSHLAESETRGLTRTNITCNLPGPYLWSTSASQVPDSNHPKQYHQQGNKYPPV